MYETTKIFIDSLKNKKSNPKNSADKFIVDMKKIATINEKERDYWFLEIKKFIDKYSDYNELMQEMNMIVKLKNSMQKFFNFLEKSNNMFGYANNINDNPPKAKYLNDWIVTFTYVSSKIWTDNDTEHKKNYSKKVFIGIQFTENYNEISGVIESVVSNNNLTPIRIDKIEHNDLIDEVLIKEMNESDLGIFEISSHNKNVYYEIGYLNAKEKQCIIICHSSELKNTGFDIRNRNMVQYNDLEELKINLDKRLKESIVNTYI